MEPITRSEQYLASIIGEDVVLPVPQSRIEHYLNLIAQNGISPSSAGLISYDPDADYPDGSLGAGMKAEAAEVDDLKSQINNSITPYVTDSMTAPAALSVGDYVMANNTLYRVISPIANGATITPNTNVVATTEADELKRKANTDGNYPNMTVGNAEQLVATVGVEDKVPYLFRTSGGSADIGDRETDMLVGGTIAWNQLVNTTDTSVTVPSGHKYYANISGVRGIGTSAGEAISVTGGTDIVIDLTQMFGSAIADYINTLETATPGAGVAWFRKLFPKPYYAYNVGELMSVKTSAHKTVGFNAFDKSAITEDKWFNYEDGTITNVNGYNLSDYIPVIPGATYYRNNTGSSRSLYFDASKNVINTGSWAVPNDTGTFTIPDNAHYIRFTLADANVDTFCINLHWDGERDGEYKPYEAHTYALDNIDLRGIPKLDADNKLYYDGDTYESDGTVTRKYGIVDLGTLSWTYYTSGTYPFFYADTSDGKRFEITSINVNAICSKYTMMATSQSGSAFGEDASPRMAVNGRTGVTGTRWLVRDGDYTDADAFKTAMSGVYLVYELATPTTESADPYQNPQIVDDFGTEEYIDARTVPIPVGHVTQYQANLRAKLEMAPNSPDSNGDYIVRHSNGQNTYVALAFPADELPAAPDTDGTYVLKVTIADGEATYSWVSE